jgi:hypothetical protein
MGAKATDAGLTHLEGLTRLDGLTLDGTRVTDNGLNYLRGLTRLDRHAASHADRKSTVHPAMSARRPLVGQPRTRHAIESAHPQRHEPQAL